MSGTQIDPPSDFLQELIDVSAELSLWTFQKTSENLYKLINTSLFSRHRAKAEVILRFEASSNSSQLNVFSHIRHSGFPSTFVLIAVLIDLPLSLGLLFYGNLIGLFFLGFLAIVTLLEYLSHKKQKQEIAFN